MRSFSNPNYGLDALNSNCVLSSDEHTSNDDVIVDNMTSLNGDRRYATDNGLPFEQATFSLFAVFFSFLLVLKAKSQSLINFYRYKRYSARKLIEEFPQR